MQIPCLLCLGPNCQREAASLKLQSVTDQTFGATQRALAARLAADPDAQAALLVLASRIVALAAPAPKPAAQARHQDQFVHVKSALRAAHACTLRMTGATANRLQLVSEMDNLLTLFQRELLEPGRASIHPDFRLWRQLLVFARDAQGKIRPNVSPKNWDQSVLRLRRILEGLWAGMTDLNTLLHCASIRALHLKGTTVSWLRAQAKHDVLYLLDRGRRAAEAQLGDGTDVARLKDTLYWLDSAIEALSKMHVDHVDSIWDDFADKVTSCLDKMDRTTLGNL